MPPQARSLALSKGFYAKIKPVADQSRDDLLRRFGGFPKCGIAYRIGESRKIQADSPEMAPTTKPNDQIDTSANCSLVF